MGKERSTLEEIVTTIDQLEQGLEDVSGLLELAVEADDEETFNETIAELEVLDGKLGQLEFRRMFSGEYDRANCYLDLQAGSGGTEAQDWASMLLRMYLRWAESRGFKTEIIEESDGDVAGLKSATVKILVNMPSVGYVLKLAYTVWYVKAHLIRAVAAIPLSVQPLSIQKLMTILILKLTRQTCVLTFTVHPVRVVSTSTKQNLRCELLIFQPIS